MHQQSSGDLICGCFTNPQEFSTLSDDILAYQFSYPVTLEGRRLPIIPSRKPERYSSAAPLTADARQRIVSELVSFPDTITISVSVGSFPPTAAGVSRGGVCMHGKCRCDREAWG